MNKKFSINEILDAVHGINPISNNRKVKELTTEKILKAVDSIQNNETAIEANSQPNEITIEINKQPEEKTVIKSTVSKTKLKKVIKVKKNNVIKKTKTTSFESPLLLTKIIKYKPISTKSLFLNKLHNSRIKIITMTPPGANK
jgi:hypothetical protein|tara:strand:+ start:1966 stop:2394 length:429 start_codon:yes stop_codon:yes gene_type:complete